MPPEAEIGNGAAAPRFSMDRFAIRGVSLVEVEKAQPAEGEERPPRIALSLQVKTQIAANPDRLRAVITMNVQVVPDPKWQPYRIEVVVSGAFAGVNVTAAQFDQFCRISVPPILFPYARAVIHSVSVDGIHGPVQLDPVNLADLAKSAEWHDEP